MDLDIALRENPLTTKEDGLIYESSKHKKWKAKCMCVMIMHKYMCDVVCMFSKMIVPKTSWMP